MKSEVKMTTDELLEKASVRPWDAVEWACRAPITIKDADGLVVADCSALGRHSLDCVPDAALIVRAVNSFEAMRKALGAWDHWDYEVGSARANGESIYTASDFAEMREKARGLTFAALKLANGENE